MAVGGYGYRRIGTGTFANQTTKQPFCTRHSYCSKIIKVPHVFTEISKNEHVLFKLYEYSQPYCLKRLNWLGAGASTYSNVAWCTFGCSTIVTIQLYGDGCTRL